jgi:hypothetical protein
MLLLSGIGNVPTPNVRLDVWDCVDYYTIRLLVCRLKIISSPNLQLIISFLVLPLVLLCHYQLLSFVASTWHAQLTLPPTPWALTSRKDDEIHADLLERYAYYHLEIRQNLPILPNQ